MTITTKFDIGQTVHVLQTKPPFVRDGIIQKVTVVADGLGNAQRKVTYTIKSECRPFDIEASEGAVFTSPQEILETLKQYAKCQ